MGLKTRRKPQANSRWNKCCLVGLSVCMKLMTILTKTQSLSEIKSLAWKCGVEQHIRLCVKQNEVIGYKCRELEFLLNHKEWRVNLCLLECLDFQPDSIRQQALLNRLHTKYAWRWEGPSLHGTHITGLLHWVYFFLLIVFHNWVH